MSCELWCFKLPNETSLRSSRQVHLGDVGHRDMDGDVVRVKGVLDILLQANVEGLTLLLDLDIVLIFLGSRDRHRVLSTLCDLEVETAISIDRREVPEVDLLLCHRLRTFLVDAARGAAPTQDDKEEYGGG